MFTNTLSSWSTDSQSVNKRKLKYTEKHTQLLVVIVYIIHGQLISIWTEICKLHRVLATAIVDNVKLSQRKG